MTIEPGVLYNWPTHVPMPAGYPPWGSDPVAWREEHTPDWLPPDPGRYHITVDTNFLADFSWLAAVLGLRSNHYLEVFQEISSDPTRSGALLENLTLAFQAEREEAFSGNEMSRGLVLDVFGAAGSGKTYTAIQMMWRDHLARHRAGSPRRHGLTPSDKWWRFGPWNMVCDTIELAQTPAARPKHASLILDDPRSPVGSEEAELLVSSLALLSDLWTKQRSESVTTARTGIAGTGDVNQSFFTERVWCHPAWRVPGAFAVVVILSRRSSDQFRYSGVYVVGDPTWDVGGPLAACPGPELLEQFKQKKREAHDKLYSGKSLSRYASYADKALEDAGAKSLDNLMTREQLFVWLAPILDAEYGLTDKAVERVHSHIWKAMWFAGYRPRRTKQTEGRWALYDKDGEVVHVLGDRPGPTVGQILWDIRSRLPLPKDRLGARPRLSGRRG